MKNSSATHMLGLVLAGAAAASASEAGAFGGSAIPEASGAKAGAYGGSAIPEASVAKAEAFGGSGIADAIERLSASAGGASGITKVPEPLSASASGGSVVRNEYTHQLLKMHVEGEGVEEEELMHPLLHYLMGFLGWTYEFGVEFNNLEDAQHAFKNYAHADDKISRHNAEEAGYTIGHNAYSHLSWEEFREHFGIGRDMVVTPSVRREIELRPRGEKAPAPMLRGEAIPDEVDWVTKGAVTPVKNQGSCGSCWSFSTTGSMEGAHFIKYGELAVLSEQELVDCDTYDMGCNGGLMDYSFHWIQQNGGICSEKDYPYTAQGDICKKTSCETVPGTMVDKWIDVDHDSEESLMAAVAQQPVSIAIEADQMSFQLYSGGVLTANCGTNLDHGVLLVGYGVSEDGIKYWKVKNSWGAEWGAEGYILLKREAPQEGGECGILMQASYPVLA